MQGNHNVTYPAICSPRLDSILSLVVFETHSKRLPDRPKSGRQGVTSQRPKTKERYQSPKPP